VTSGTSRSLHCSSGSLDAGSGRLVWVAAGRDRKTVESFLDALGEERCKQIEVGVL